jgi:hypothetical protein
VFSSIHPRTDEAFFTFNLSTDSGSNYNVTKTTTLFRAYHSESGTGGILSYDNSQDLAQSTAFQNLAESLGNGADENASGSLLLFNPSSTTYVKHFMSRISENHSSDLAIDYYMAGYGNTTSACNAIQFKMSSGNMDGTIYLYGIK